MKISIITVCFNSEDTIRDTIVSVLSQDYPNIEYIIIDGLSKDNTMKIVSEYSNKISKMISEPDEGIYDAMNKGIQLATGDYVGILNSDDIFAHNHVVSDIVDLLEESKADSIYGDLVIVDREIISNVIRSYSSRNFQKWKVRFGLILPHPTFYIKRNLFNRFGYYKLNYRVAADFELITRFLHGGITYVRNPDVMVKMRRGGVSNSGIFGRIHQNFEIVRACKENGIYTNIFLVALKLPVKFFSYLVK